MNNAILTSHRQMKAALISARAVLRGEDWNHDEMSALQERVDTAIVEAPDPEFMEMLRNLENWLSVWPDDIQDVFDTLLNCLTPEGKAIAAALIVRHAESLNKT